LHIGVAPITIEFDLGRPMEFDDVAYGIVLNVDDLKRAALGTVIGTTIAMTGIVLALAAIIAPCEFEVPKSYLVLFVASPLVMYAFAVTGALTVVPGVVLVLLFVAFVAWIAYRERAARRPVWRNAEFYEQVEMAEAGVSEGGGTATLVGGGGDGTGSGGGPGGGHPGFELPPDLLTVEPQRRGAPEIGIANVLGSVVFSVTGKLGIVLLVGGAITVDADVLRWHVPVLVVMTALSAGFLATGRLRRWHGAVLLGLYVVYFVLSLTLFNGVPVDSS
jgi:cation:H+ antiporter